MAKKQADSVKQTDSVFRIIDVVGVSENSWEDAGRVLQPGFETLGWAYSSGQL